MNDSPELTGISFAENGSIDVEQLNALYRLIGWDRHGRRDSAETRTMLAVSHYYVAAYGAQNFLVGFARVSGDPYVAQVLDVITHPDYRKRGIATRCMLGVQSYLERSAYVSVTLTHDSELATFYERFGFRPCADSLRKWSRFAPT